MCETQKQRSRMHLTQSLHGMGQITTALWDLSSLYVKLGGCSSSVVPKPAGKGEINTHRHTLMYSHTLPQLMGKDPCEGSKQEAVFLTSCERGISHLQRPPASCSATLTPAVQCPSASAQLPSSVLSTDTGLQPPATHSYRQAPTQTGVLFTL